MATETVQQIERAITALTPAEQAELLDWFEQQESLIDIRIARDLESGRLDHAIAEALLEHQKGLTQPL